MYAPTRRRLPVRCFCGMPVNHLQARYDQLVSAGGMEPREALDAVQATRLCCRTWLQTGAVDPTIRRPMPEHCTFAAVQRDVGMDGARPFTLLTYAPGEPVEDEPDDAWPAVCPVPLAPPRAPTGLPGAASATPLP